MNEVHGWCLLIVAVSMLIFFGIWQSEKTERTMMEHDYCEKISAGGTHKLIVKCSMIKGEQ